MHFLCKETECFPPDLQWIQIIGTINFFATANGQQLSKNSEGAQFNQLLLECQNLNKCQIPRLSHQLMLQTAIKLESLPEATYQLKSEEGQY